MLFKVNDAGEISVISLVELPHQQVNRNGRRVVMMMKGKLEMVESKQEEDKGGEICLYTALIVANCCRISLS